ncbi:ATP-grasp domain-containing protein, partial [Streptomyces albireticuli]
MAVDHIVIVEALTGGTGLRLVEAATRRAARVTFLTRDKTRYLHDPLRDLLEPGGVETRVGDTRSVRELAALFEALRAEGEFALIAPDEECLLPAATAAEELGIPFLPAASVRLIQDKHAFRLACEAGGVPTPRGTAAADVEAAVAAAEAIGYPVVLKPSLGTGSHGVVSAADEEEVRWHFTEVLAEADGLGGVPLVEEFLTGAVVSAEVLYAGGVPRVLGIDERVVGELPYFMELAVRSPGGLSAGADADEGAGARERVERVCGDLVRVTGYGDGPARVEFVLTAYGPKVVGFTPGFAGCDRDGFDCVVASYLGEAVHVPEPVLVPVGAGGVPLRGALSPTRPFPTRGSAPDPGPQTPDGLIGCPGLGVQVPGPGSQVSDGLSCCPGPGVQALEGLGCCPGLGSQALDGLIGCLSPGSQVPAGLIGCPDPGSQAPDGRLSRPVPGGKAALGAAESRPWAGRIQPGRRLRPPRGSAAGGSGDLPGFGKGRG